MIMYKDIKNRPIEILPEEVKSEIQLLKRQRKDRIWARKDSRDCWKEWAKSGIRHKPTNHYTLQIKRVSRAIKKLRNILNN